MTAFRRSAHRGRVLFWGAAALALWASLGGNVFVVPVPFWREPAPGYCSLGSLGRKASSQELPYHGEELYQDLVDIAAVWGMCVEFGNFAYGLLPRPRFPIDDIQGLIKGHADKLFPNCKVSLVGSCNRDVHNKFFSDLDFHISNTRGEPTPKEFQIFCNLLKYDPRIGYKAKRDTKRFVWRSSDCQWMWPFPSVLT